MTTLTQHIPVLEKEIQEKLITPMTKTIFDGTLGLGGHAKIILTNFPGIKKYKATDLDEQHLMIAKEKLKKFKDRTDFHLGSFSEIDRFISENTERPLAILLDLGLCSNHVDDPKKGFSFTKEGPLKMSFDESNKAEIFLNTASVETIKTVFFEYGEIRNAFQIARGIEKERNLNPITTTTQLKTIIEKHTHPKVQKKVLTLAFQAIRIQVNNELEILKITLNKTLRLMKKSDRIGVISYHSLEDRIVKKKFQAVSKPTTQKNNFSLHAITKEADFFCPTKKPIIPSSEEININPRSRSAKLRILEKK